MIVRKGKEETKTVDARPARGRREDAELAATASRRRAEKPAVKKALGPGAVAASTDELRRRYSIKDTVKGVRRDPCRPELARPPTSASSPATSSSRCSRSRSTTPDAVIAAVDALKKEGKKSALLLVSNAQGEVRFVAVGLD